MHKKHIHLFLPVTILNSKVKYRSFFYRKIWQLNLSTPNHADTKNWALLSNKNIEKMCFWRPFLVLFIWRWKTPEMLSDRFELRTPNFLKRKNTVLKCRAKFNVFYFNPEYIQTFSKKGYNILSFKKKCMSCTDVTTSQFQAYTYLDSEILGLL